MATISIQTRDAAAPHRWFRRLLASPAAALAVAAVWLLAEKATGLELHQPAFGSASPRPLSVGFAVAVAALAALVGWALLALFERISVRGARLWLWTALVVLALSLAGPLSGHGVSAGNRATLVLMHIAGATVVIPYLYRTAGRRTERPPRRRAER